MNKSYRTVWNASTGTWSAAAETARAQSKGASRTARKALVAVALGGAAIGSAAAGEVCTAADGTEGMVDASGACGVRTDRSGSTMSTSAIGTNDIGTMATLDDAYIKVLANGTAPAAVASGRGSVAIGSGAVASSGTDGGNIAIGNGATANTTGSGGGYGTMAIGTAARAGSTGFSGGAAIGMGAQSNFANWAIGDGAQAMSASGFSHSMAIGNDSRASGFDAIGFGKSANAAGTNAIAIGTGAAVRQTYTDIPVNGIAIGNNALVGDGQVTAPSGAIAIGDSARSAGRGSIAFGANTGVLGSNSTAIGNSAYSQRGVALGAFSNGTVDGAVALGVQASSTAANGVALGSSSLADRANSVSVGSSTLQRQIVNVAAGTQGTDAVNLNQLNAAIASVPSDANPYVAARGSTAARATGTRSIAIGDGAVARNTAGDGQTNIAIGAGANTAGGFGQIAFGEGASAENSAAGGAIAIGRNATTTERGVALGDGASATARYSVALGDGSISSQQDTVSIGNAGLQRRIVNLAAGTASTDAVNVGQLSSVAGALGGGAKVNPDGSIEAPTYTVGGTDVRTIGDAVSNLDGRVTGNTGAISDLKDQLANTGLVDPATGQAIAAVTYDRNADGSTNRGAVTLGGADATSPVALKNVAAGTAATDAVNVGQMDSALATKLDDTFVKVNPDLSNTHGATAVGERAVAIGGNAYANNLNPDTRALGHGAVAIGENASATAAHATAVGGAATAGYRGSAFGDAASATGMWASALGMYAGAVEDWSTAVGAFASASGVSATAIGEESRAQGRNSTALGAGAWAQGDAAVALGSDSVADRDHTVSVGSATQQRQITNMAAGTAGTDAVNVNQLSGVVDAMGGGAKVNPDGSIEAPTYTVGGTDVRTIGDAVSNLDGRVTGNTGAISDLKDQLANTGLVDPTTGAAIAAVTYDRNADGSANRGSVTLGGMGATAPVSLKNVAAGTAGTDAVNVDQLTGATQSIRDDLADGTLDMRYIKVNATGVQANAAGPNAVAIGSGANANGSGALALGTGSRAQGLNSVALGFNSVATQANTVSVGRAGAERKIVNVAQGDVSADSTDAINGSQLYDALNSLTTTFDQKTQKLAESSSRSMDLMSSAGTMDVTAPLVAVEGLQGNNTASLNGSDAATTTAVAIGSSSVAAGGNAVAVGLQNVAGSNNAVAIGSFAQTGADSDYATAIGSNVQATGSEAVAIGANVEAGADNALVIGSNNARAIGAGSIALGDNARVNAGGANSIAIGTNAAVATNVANALALGAGATVAAGSSGGVALGQGSVANRGNAVSVGGGTVGQRQIINVAAGTAATDAVNVSQLTGLTTALGGGTAVGASGTITQPTYTVGGKDYHNVGDAIAAAAAAPGEGGTDPNAVAYDDDTKGLVTLAGGVDGTAITNLKAGAVNATSKDAINGSQLYGTAQSVADALGGGATVGADGKVEAPTYTVGGTDVRTVGDALSNLDGRVTDNTGDISDLKDKLVGSGLVDPTTGAPIAAVTYDDATKGSVTLAGDASTGTVIRNVGAGELSATSKDAVNGSQLFATNQQVGDLKDKLSAGGVFDPTTGESLAVTYTNAGKTAVQLGNDGTPVRVSNVADAQADNDAVNLKQLKDSGLVAPVDPTDPGAGLKSLAVTYDKNPDGSANFDSLTLAGGTDGTAIHNVAAGAVNATSKDAINGSQLYGTAQSVADALGGGATVGADGKVEAPTYTVGGTDVRTVGDALSNLDGRVTGNTGDISDLKDKLADSGLVDPATGKAVAAVTYDNSTTKSSVTLGGTGATAPVALKNVADGVDRYDAVNLGQLQSAGLVAPVDPTDPGAGLKSLAVTYDKNPDGSANFDSLTLAGGTDGTAIHNVTAGAVNATSKDALNGSQLYGTAQSVADALGGGATVGADGKVEAPTYTVGGTDVRTVGDALSNLDGRVTGNTGDISDLKDKLADSGLVDPATGKAIAAVTYDDATKGSVTLAGDASTGTAIHNVGAGELSATSKDAVNGSQLFATNQQVGDLKDKLSAGGVIDPTTGESLAVTYTNAGKTAVQLGNDGTPVRVSNVAAGTAGTDAVNVAQMQSGLTDLREDLTNGAIDLRFIKVNADPATGVAAIANGAQAVAIGSGAGATGAHALALGTGARASGLDSVALGYNSVATQANTVSVGRVGNERRIVNVGDGNVAFESKDAINGGQLYAALNGITTSVNSTTQQAIDELSSSLDAKTKAALDQMNANSAQLMTTPDSLVAIEGVQSPNSASLNGANPATDTAVAIGSGAVAAGGNAVANGLNALAMSNNATAIGSFAQVGDASDYGVAMGSNAQATGKEAVALGANVEAGADNALAIGSGGAQAVGAGSVALGNHAVVNAGAANSIAVGSNTNIARNVTDALALGSGANVAAGANGGIALGAGSIANRGNALSIGSAGAERQIINVAAGTAQTDAVNVSQLAGVTKALGGSAGVGADGSVTQPTYTVNGKQYSNVGDALVAAAETGSGTPAEGSVAYDDAEKRSVTLGGVGATPPVALKNVADGVDDHDAVNVAQLKSSGLVADDGSGNLTSLAVAYDDVNKDTVTLGGTGATDAVALKNVAAGAVNATSRDAINGSQLFGTAQSVATALGGGATVGADGTITQPTFKVGGTDVHTVGEALTNLDGRTTANTGDIGDLRKQLGNTGLVDTGTGQTLAAVTYDVDPATGAPNRGSVTLGGAAATAPVALKNVADGVDDHDAVNVSQLKATGLVGEGEDGKLTSLAVAYDDAEKGTITLGGGDAGTKISNVAAGAVSASSTDAINGSQLYGTAQSVADTLGGGVTVNADGTVSKASFLVNGDHYATVEDALTASSKSGATDSLAVKYDNVEHTRVSLGGTGAPAPVVLTNVADGTSKYDAVNFGQLSDLKDQIGSMDGRVGALEASAGGPGGGSGGGDVVGGTGGSGDTSGPIVVANPGTGNGNVAIGSGSTIADGANNGTAIGSGSNVGGTGGTAIGSGSKAADAGSTAIGQGSSVAAGAGNSVAIGQGSVATESSTVSFGSSGNERRLVNIADGVNATDAATKGQLDRAMGGMQNQVNDLSRNAYSGIAAATALTMIPGVDADKTISFGIGGATYKGYQAVAFGGEARITQNLKMKAGVGMSSGGNTVGVGASYQW